MSSTIPYRPDIDGLRAVAVVGVILYHLDETILPGGFTGVDVFFVISGFLLTKIIVLQCRQSRFTFSDFYRRRIARLFPVLIVTTVAILVVARLVYSTQEFASVGALAIASVLSVANVKLMFHGNGYFDITEDAVPFLHFWSLSLEEQFYVFLPLLLILMFSLGLKRRAKFSILAAITAASFLGGVYLSYINAKYAFYLLPTRAWELLAGSLLGLYQLDNPSLIPARWVNLARSAGIGLVLISFIAIGDTAVFPGWIALLPVAGTLLLLLRSGAERDYVEAALSSHPTVWIGKLSYSLYLWHWPVFCFINYQYFYSDPSFRISLQIGLTLILSVASYYVVEQPLRRKINRLPSPRRVFAGAVTAVLLVSALGYHVRSNYYLNASPENVAQGGVVINEDGEGPFIVFLGDSMGSMYGESMSQIADSLDARVHIMSVAGGDPLHGSGIFDRSVQFLQRTEPDIALLAAQWVGKVYSQEERLHNTVDEVASHVEHLILLNQPPILPEYASREYFRKHGMAPIREASSQRIPRSRVNRMVGSFGSRPGVSVVDAASLFVKPDSTISYMSEMKEQLYRDQHHLSGYGADRVVPSILTAIRQAQQPNEYISKTR